MARGSMVLCSFIVDAGAVVVRLDPQMRNSFCIYLEIAPCEEYPEGLIEYLGSGDVDKLLKCVEISEAQMQRTRLHSIWQTLTHIRDSHAKR